MHTIAKLPLLLELRHWKRICLPCFYEGLLINDDVISTSNSFVVLTRFLLRV